MKRKWLAVQIILLFVGTSLIPAIAQVIEEPLPILRGDWLYVGGSGPGNYTRIQDAVDNASDGNTVFVFDDSAPYGEQILVNKSIKLIGENKDTTVINGNVDLFADYVTITGFTIQYGDSSEILLIESENNIITDNIIFNINGGGISIANSSNIISNNSIIKCENSGILMESSNNVICDNYISTCHAGICDCGNNNTIARNCIVKSEDQGIHCSGSSTVITGNIITDSGNGIGGEDIGMIGVIDSIISENDITGSLSKYWRWSIDLLDCSNNTISRNNLIGIWGAYSSKNEIFGNVFSHEFVGIKLDFSPKNIIYSNIFKNLSTSVLLSTNYSCNNSIYHNDFISNKQNAYDVSDIINFFDDGYPSGGNYWDDYTGIDSNGDGIGDTPYKIPNKNNTDRYPLMKPYNDDNLPPETQFIDGSRFGKVGVEYNYTFVATDPDQDNVYYYILWGDDTVSGWLGPYTSGKEITISHVWLKKGAYTIKIKAKDSNGLFSAQWGILKTYMPRSMSYTSLFMKFFERFPNAFPILRHLLERFSLDKNPI